MLVKALQLVLRGNRIWGDTKWNGAQDVTQLLVLLQQSLQLLHTASLLLSQAVDQRTEVLLLLEHAKANLILDRDRVIKTTYSLYKMGCFDFFLGDAITEGLKRYNVMLTTEPEM